MHFRQLLLVALPMVTGYSTALFAATHMVSKGGNEKYSTIQAAVNAAKPGDDIVILDASVYEEQVTIDSTKNGLHLYSKVITAAKKPTILFKDTFNVGPRTTEEAQIDSMITFDRNGALQILGAENVIIEGIAVEGGGVTPFGYKSVWSSGNGQTWPNQFGNGGITLFMSGNCIIRQCDISGAFYGISVKDQNTGGIFAPYNPSDVDSGQIISFASVGKTGNHVIEYNRIHDNSFGIYFESVWDGGSVIRYNLVYENHHPTPAIAAKVKDLTSEGGNLPGGAILTKDHLVSPLAIYNNTFWHNHVIFVGIWKAGGQHLVFNNLFSSPEVYNSDVSQLDMFKSMANRLYNNVFAAQVQAPSANLPIRITNEIQVAKEGDEITKIGTATLGANADNYSLETKFRSTDPVAAGFLEPDWSDSLVKTLIIDKGYAASGIMDLDGSPADIGALPQGGGRSATVATIHPVCPVSITGGAVTLRFTLDERIGTFTTPKVVLINAVKNLDTSDVFGSTYKAINSANIVSIIPPISIVAGANRIDVAVPSIMGNYGFFEMVLQGTGSDGWPATAVGLLPYRRLDYTFDVAILDKITGDTLKVVRSGTPVDLCITAKKQNALFTSDMSVNSVKLFTGSKLLLETGVPLESIPRGIDSGRITVTVVFPVVSASTFDVVQVAGESLFIPFFGVSTGINVLPPISSSGHAVLSGTAKTTVSRYEVIDLKGRIIKKMTDYTGKRSLSHKVAVIPDVGTGIYLIRQIDDLTGTVKSQRMISVTR